MKSKKPIWSFKAKSCRVTKSGTLTVEDRRSPYLTSGTIKVIKSTLSRKRRYLKNLLED